MDNKITNTYSPKSIRTAERSDTQQKIRRHDPEFERRRDEDEGEEHEEEDIYEHLTDVSIEGLIELLKNFSQENRAAQNNASEEIEIDVQTEDISVSEPEETERLNTADPKASRAANAYQHALETRPDYDPNVQRDLKPENLGVSQDAVFQERTVIDLIRDLESLLEKGFTSLQLERAESGDIVDSVKDAIERAFKV